MHYEPCRCGGLATCYCGQILETRFAKTKSRVEDSRPIRLRDALVYFAVVARYGLRPVMDFAEEHEARHGNTPPPNFNEAEDYRLNEALLKEAGIH